MKNMLKQRLLNNYQPLVIRHENAAKLSQDPELSACQKHEF